MARLFRFEWKKSYGRRSVLLVILLFTVLNFANIAYSFRSDSWLADSPGWQKAYWKLYDQLSGPITQESIHKLRQVYDPLAEKMADFTFNRVQDPNSLTGINEYSDYLMMESFYVLPMQIFLEYREKAQRIAENAQENIHLYNRLGNDYESRKNVKIYHLFVDREIDSFAYTEVWDRLSDYTFSSWLALLVCLFAACNAFSQEKEVQMCLLLDTTPNGRKKTAAAKCLSAIAFAVLVTLWFSLVDWLGFAWVYQTFSGCSMPVYALTDFATSPLQCSLGLYFVLCTAMRILGTLVFTLLCCGISSLSSNALYPFLLSAAIALGCSGVATATQNLYHPCWKAFNPASLLFPKSLFSHTEYWNCCGEPILVPLVTVIFTLLCIASVIIFLCRKGKPWKSLDMSLKK